MKRFSQFLSALRFDRARQLLSTQIIRATLLSDGVITPDHIETILLQDGHILITLEIDPAQLKTYEKWRIDMMRKLESLPRVESAKIILTAQREAGTREIVSSPVSGPARGGHTAIKNLSQEPRPFAPQVKSIIAVASGKGGVGKSTVAVNLAVALAQSGVRVGLLDADIYGPSVPLLLGIQGQKPVQEDDYLLPIQAHGIAAMSMGFLTQSDTPLIWRGPMVQSALQQLLRDVKWGDLDVLILDMPPGTGDAQLTVAQKVPLKGAVIVSTPQDIALLDAVKGIEMFRKVNVPIIGLVENMSQFCCPSCGTISPIFGHGGAQEKAKTLDVPFLGALPLEVSIRHHSDVGIPVVEAEPQSHAVQIFKEMAEKIRLNLAL
jgi:ATP-binding protein involved in chromosome partitioning